MRLKSHRLLSRVVASAYLILVADRQAVIPGKVVRSVVESFLSVQLPVVAMVSMMMKSETNSRQQGCHPSAITAMDRRVPKCQRMMTRVRATHP